MRHTPSAIYGIVNQRPRLTRRRLVALITAALIGWMAWSLAQEFFLTRGLARQTADLRQQNAALQSENNAYQRDNAASTSGAAAEEEARQDGYSKPKEKLYLVGDSPSPSPPPSPSTAGKRHSTAQGGGKSGGQSLGDRLIHLFLP